MIKVCGREVEGRTGQAVRNRFEKKGYVVTKVERKGKRDVTTNNMKYYKVWFHTKK
jgi:hypothetical protein